MFKLADLFDEGLEVIDAGELHRLAVDVGSALARLVLQHRGAAEHHYRNVGHFRVVGYLWRRRWQLVISEP